MDHDRHVPHHGDGAAIMHPMPDQLTGDSDLAGGTSIISVETAKSLVALFARVTTSRNVDDFVGGFTEDCVVRFNCHPEIHGRAALREFMSGRLGSFPDSFRCEKRLRAISGNVLGVEWCNTWVDPKTNKPMTGRGAEYWIMRGEQISRWDASYAAG